MENQGNKPALLDQAHAASSSPGVYLMKNEAGETIYVGKAKSLRSRLSQYFQAAPHENPRTEMMVARVARFDVILTETEAEALILECTLIKKHKPRFNVRLKDDKTYPYLKIRVNEPYPRIEYTRRTPQDGSRYFGPFPSAWSARQVMDLLNQAFKLRDCSDNTFRHRSRPCILYQIGKCSGGCVGLVNPDEYREHINEVIAVLEGKTSRIIGELMRGMEDAASREEFELAAEYRDQIGNLELVTQTQVAAEAGSQRDRDVVGIARRDSDAHGTILRIRNGRMIAVLHFHVQNSDTALKDSEILFEFLSQHYLEKKEDERIEGGRPPEVLLPIAPEDSDLLERTLGLRVRVPESPTEERLVSVARTNAEYALEQNRRKEGGHGAEALEEIREKLHLARLPRRIECFDISNIQGQDSVASRVVFIDGAPDKNLYRRYKIRTVEGANDFASMKEVLGRRFRRMVEGEADGAPDLVVVDGGKGQLSQAVAILEELGVSDVQVVGLAKARTESDFRSSDVKSSLERIFIPNRKNPVPLLPHTGAYKLLTHIRDEAHRFAITYHRNLRSKRSLASDR
ncbi:MAG: excinuclease ABC subunit UvrC [Oligoflexia bacterium]|nr:excinuclease ABC subunit UvrC [Oligoflexia bacterium]